MLGICTIGDGTVDAVDTISSGGVLALSATGSPSKSGSGIVDSHERAFPKMSCPLAHEVVSRGRRNCCGSDHRDRRVSSLMRLDG